MAAKSKPRESLTLADLGIAVDGAQQLIANVSAAPARQSGTVIEDDGNAHQQIVAFLTEQKVI
jgi:electron transfer flavoprotein alpha/beta subunit